MQDENYGLPFDYHYTESTESVPACVIIWTTTGPVDADTIDHVAVIDVPDVRFSSHPLSIAEFVTKALNAYVSTNEGFEEWKKVYGSLPSNYLNK